MITWSDLVLPPINLWSLPSQPTLTRKRKMSTEEGNTDLAALHEEMIREKSIAAIRKEAAKIDTSNPTGLCWNCGEYIGYTRRWCDADCRDVYENN
jgi:RNA polymerase-binding transcription factor DksA